MRFLQRGVRNTMTEHCGVVRDESGLRAGLHELDAIDEHNRADYPELDKSLQVNFVWSGPGQLTREPIPAIPSEIAGLMRDVSVDGKLVE